MVIETRQLMKFYNTELIKNLIETISNNIDELKKNTGKLKGLFAQHEKKLEELIANRKEDINQFVNKKLGLEKDNTENREINQSHLNAVLEGMKSVTSDRGGTAHTYFKNFNIEVGGKTGSAQAGKEDDPNSKVHAWFIGFAPFDDPEIAVVIVVENGGHGAYTAEAARDVMAQYFGMNANQITEDVTAIPYIMMQN